MKIEVAESLLASWCRHIKQCQIVQTNWKASPTWEFNHRETLETLMQVTNEWFTREFGYNIYKARGLSQLIKQAEIDVLGLRLDSDGIEIYAIDVAFHEGGLLYGNPQETIEKVVKKCLRAVMCIRGYFGLTTGEIIFASPKIAESVLPTMRASRRYEGKITSDWIEIRNEDHRQ